MMTTMTRTMTMTMTTIAMTITMTMAMTMAMTTTVTVVFFNMHCPTQCNHSPVTITHPPQRAGVCPVTTG